MRRAKQPINTTLRRDLTYNPATQLYEIKENNILYGMPLEMTRLLNEFTRRGIDHLQEEGPISSWYNTLSRPDKRKVVRTGNINDTNNDFYDGLAFE